MSGVKGKSGVYKRSENHKKRISDALRGHPNWGYKKGEGYFKGKKLSEKHKEHLRKVKLGKKQPNIAAALMGRKLSKEVREKMSIARSGEKHWNWRGGTPIEINKNYTNHRWKKLRFKIVIRDNYICQNCMVKKESRKLHVHHIEPYKKTKNNNESNLVTLCIICHKKFFDLKDNKLLK